MEPLAIRLGRPGQATSRVGRPAAARRDALRMLQLGLGAFWLLDGILQLQGVFFSRQFASQMLRPMAVGNPWFISQPITWSAQQIAHHAVLANSAFAILQLLIGLGIAYRPTVRVALAVSIVWSLGVWWIGEGLGGVLNQTADPVNGAPGAVMLYALLAVLLWPRQGVGRPAEAPGSAPFPAATGLGANPAKALWLVLWGSLAYFAVAGTNSSGEGLSRLVGVAASGQPTWLASLERGVAEALAGRGLVVSIVLAVLLGVVAIGPLLPAGLANSVLCLAIVLALAFWVAGEGLGGLLAGAATDVNSGPLLALLALSFWRRPVGSEAAAATRLPAAELGGA
jgi:hypothetical protein